MTLRRFTPVLSVLRSTARQTKVTSLVASVRTRVGGLLLRRPHRSFQLTRRRDYVRSLVLPGYWRFSAQVWTLLWSHKKLFGSLALVYAVLTLVLVGVASQDTYREASSAIQTAGDASVLGGLRAIEQASLVFLTAVSGNLSADPDTAQQVYAGLIGLLAWLTTVWLLRAIMAGQTPRLRDGLYSAGSPILPTFLLSLVLIVQLLPVAVVGIGYTAASASGLLEGGIEAMLFWAAAALLVTLSLYWATSTFMALIIVTLPGMYPLKALRSAGDLVVGRRMRIVLRLLWVILLVTVAWALVMIPLIMGDTWLKAAIPAAAWVPVVPMALLILGSVTIITVATYIYLLYRKVVEDDAAPATN